MTELDTPFIGSLAGYADTLCWSEETRDEAEWASCLRSHLICHHASVGGDRRAAGSLWSQIYFNALLIPATCLIAKGWQSDAAVRWIRPHFCPNSGVARRFTLGGERRGAFDDMALAHWLEVHLSRVIKELADVGKLSEPMLWESAELTLRWVAGELKKHQLTYASRLRHVALRAQPGTRFAPAWIAGDCHRQRIMQRRFCCLRFQLDGYPTCPEICPRRPLQL